MWELLVDTVGRSPSNGAFLQALAVNPFLGRFIIRQFPEETMRADSGKSQSQQRNDSAIVLQQTAGNTVLTGQTQSKASETWL